MRPSLFTKHRKVANFLKHADRDPEFQARCLALLVNAGERGDVRLLDVAYLTDRVRVKQGRPQLYATQYGGEQLEPGGSFVYLAPMVEDPEHLDSVRKTLPVELNGVVMRALAKEASDRYPSCFEFAEAVRDVLGVSARCSSPPRSPARIRSCSKGGRFRATACPGTT